MFGNSDKDEDNMKQFDKIMQRERGAQAFVNELNMAREKFGPMVSAHEGYAVIMEEIDELWSIVKQKQSERDYVALKKETVQCGAMILAFLVEIVETENRR